MLTPEETSLATQAIDSVMRQFGKQAAKAVFKKVFPKKKIISRKRQLKLSPKWISSMGMSCLEEICSK